MVATTVQFVERVGVVTKRRLRGVGEQARFLGEVGVSLRDVAPTYQNMVPAGWMILTNRVASAR